MTRQSEAPAASGTDTPERARPTGVAGRLRNFARRSPLSAFWGCVALAIV